jgi:hypothetical protein
MGEGWEGGGFGAHWAKVALSNHSLTNTEIPEELFLQSKA